MVLLIAAAQHTHDRIDATHDPINPLSQPTLSTRSLNPLSGLQDPHVSPHGGGSDRDRTPNTSTHAVQMSPPRALGRCLRSSKILAAATDAVAAK